MYSHFYVQIKDELTHSLTAEHMNIGLTLSQTPPPQSDMGALSTRSNDEINSR